MVYVIEELMETLKQARLKKGLSQRSFAKKIGKPQSYLSRIEKGDVDIQTSNLIELARNLGLELVLVPKERLPVVTHLIRQIAASDGRNEIKPLYNLDRADKND